MKVQNENRFIIDQKEGYTPAIGRLVAMMENTRDSTLEAVEGMTTEELDARIDGNGNSIACLLHHIACLEDVYQIMTFEDRDPNEEEIQRLEVGLNLGERAHEEIKNHPIEVYQDQLKRVRERTLHKFKGKEDLWLDEITSFGPYYQANNYYRWFHVFEDELTHLGQIRLIQKQLRRKK